MPRLIDAEALKESLTESLQACREWVDRIRNSRESLVDIERAEQAEVTFCEAILRLKAMSTVDAVPVVRCKDCQYRNNVANCERFGRERYVQGNSYCSWGERREDAETN